MGNRGPAPTPTAILKLRDSEEVKRREKYGEPTPQRGIPKRPSYLKGDARALWTSVTNMLDNMGVVTVADGFPIERYVDMMMDWRQMKRVKDKWSASDSMLESALLKDQSRLILRFVRTELGKLDQALKQIENQFGLNPSARARLSTLVFGDRKPADTDDRESRFFGNTG